MSTKITKRGVTVAVLGCTLLGACSSELEESSVDEQPAESLEAELIAGFPANGSGLNAIGALVLYSRDPATGSWIDPFCTGTLIAPRTVLTSKYCAARFGSAYPYARVGFAIGPNGMAPERVVEIIDRDFAPDDVGGFRGYGHDVGVYYLAEAITDIAPLRFRAPRPTQVGRDFVGVGYGIQDNSWTRGTRRAGTLELRALEGPIAPILFGSFEAFYEWYTGEPLPSDGGDPAYVDFVRSLYEGTLLDAGYEFIAGGTEGDAQPCEGDWGGPLLRPNASGELVVYGVASTAIGSREQVCDYGAIYATFGPGVDEFVRASRRYVDPCRGLSYTGICEGNVARRCTNPAEGERRLVELDCATLGEVCAIQPSGEVGCGGEPN